MCTQKGPLQDIQVHCLVLCQRVVIAQPKVNHDLHMGMEPSIKKWSLQHTCLVFLKLAYTDGNWQEYNT
jgi:hypothetical protein